MLGESVMRMREKGEGCDLDIFLVGSVRDIMRFVGATVHISMAFADRCRNAAEGCNSKH